VQVLGIDIGDETLDAWRAWLMPSTQPFVVPRSLAERNGWPDARRELAFEVVDTFELYGVGPDEAIVWLARPEARALPPEVRRNQPAPHRWPSADAVTDRLRAVRFVEAGRRASRHRELDGRWGPVDDVLPGARAIAGTFAGRSGPNCFGTVMGAAGVSGASEEWMQLAPFEEWLAAATVPARADRDDRPGTVLVWRTTGGDPAHAAVTLGGGFLLHKPSQGWMSPRKVLTVAEGKFSARRAGLHLTRRALAS
jgi:hypothetical protein